MRKLLYTFAGLTALAMIASCNKEAESSSSSGEKVRAVFNVSLPETVPTKAISDGLTATELKFYAYDANGKHLDLDQTVTVTGRTATVTADLVKGIKYQFVFWAQKPSQYTPDAAAGTLTVTPADMMNSDNWDAFYWHEPLAEVTAAFTKAITLNRPFAQINVGAPVTLDAESNRTGGDFFGAQKSGLLIDGTLTSGYTVKAYTKLNLLTGEVSGMGDAAIAMTKVSHPNEFLTVNETKYDYAAMAYVLAGTDAETVDLELNLYTTQNDADVNLTRSVPNVPIRRNYRTNILGNVFTVTGNFNITVDQSFSDVDAYNDDYFPQYTSIDALNAAFAAGKGIGYTVELAPAAAVSGAQTIVLPNTEDEVSIFFRGDFTNADIKFEYSSVAEALKPAKLVIEAPDIDNDEDTPSIKSLSGELASTTVILNGTTVVSNASFHTASNTLHITKDARIINELTVYAGSLLVEGFIETAVIDPAVAVNTVDAVARVAEDGEVVRFVVQNLNAVIESGAKVGTLEVSTTAGYGGAAPTVTIEGDVEKVVASTETGATVAPTVTITDDATVETVQQQGDAQVVISEDATVGEVEAKDPANISGDGAEDVNYLIKNEDQLTAAVAAKVASMKMGADFTITKGYTIDFQTDIDLGKYTISVDGTTDSNFSDQNARAFKFVGTEEMTVKIHNGEINLLDNKLYGPFRFDNTQSDYVLDRLTLNNSRSYGLGIKVVNAKSFSLSNSTINSVIGGGIEKGCNSPATLTNVTINQTEDDAAHYISSAVAACYGGPLTVVSGSYSACNPIFLYSSGGTIEVQDGIYTGRDAAIRVQNNTYEEDYSGASVVNVSGGTFSGKLMVEAWGAANTTPNSTLNISGGTFTADQGELFYTDGQYSHIVITGGSFSEDPSDYLAEGYIAVQDDNNQYVVVPGSYVHYDSTVSAQQNGTALFNAIKNGPQDQVILVDAGVYEVDNNVSRLGINKAFTLEGVGEGDVIIKGISNRYAMVLDDDTNAGLVVNLKNITLQTSHATTSALHPLYVKNYVTVNLYDVTIDTDYFSAICLDSCNQVKQGGVTGFYDGVDTVVNAYGLTIGEGTKIELNANPCSTTTQDVVTYAHFNFDDNCVNVLAENCVPQWCTRSTGSNLFVNGTALPAYEN